MGVLARLRHLGMMEVWEPHPIHNKMFECESCPGLVNDFVIDDKRLKHGKQIFGKNDFDELLEGIRETRASERRFNQEIADIDALSVGGL